MLGGGFLQAYVIKKARDIGYEVLVLDGNPHAVGFQYAHDYAVIDIKDEEACLEYAKSKRIDGVMTAATEFPVLVVSRIAEELGLPGLNYDTAKIIKNKAAVRRCFLDAQVDDTSCLYEITSLDDVEELLSNLQFPLMVKPCDGSGSRGVSKVECKDAFHEACEYAMKGSVSHRIFAEPFFDGKDYGVESFVENGDIRVLGIMQKEMTNPPYYAELGHAMPSGLSDEMEKKIKDCVIKAIKSLGVNYGAVNMDILVSEQGKIHIVDIGARMGGNLIGSHIISCGTGVDYMGNIIRSAVGDPTLWTQVSRPQPIATKLLALQPGIVKSLPDIIALEQKHHVAIEHHLHIGDMITPYRTNIDGCGYVIVKKDNVDEAIGTAAKVRNIIDQLIVRE